MAWLKHGSAGIGHHPFFVENIHTTIEKGSATIQLPQYYMKPTFITAVFSEESPVRY
jgi:hypothetical protein